MSRRAGPRPRPRVVMTPPTMPISAGKTSAAVATMAFRMTVSNSAMGHSFVTGVHRRSAMAARRGPATGFAWSISYSSSARLSGCPSAPDGALARERAQPLDSAVMADSPGDLLPGPRVLLGPGPTMADPRVLRAMTTPLLGQFDPEFTAVMNEVVELLRAVFQTDNERAFPVPGTGRAGLEAAMVSLLEPGDRVVV